MFDFSIGKLVDEARDGSSKIAKRIYVDKLDAYEVIGHRNIFDRSLSFVIKRNPQKLYALVVNAEGGLWKGQKTVKKSYTKELPSHRFSTRELESVSNTTKICVVN